MCTNATAAGAILMACAAAATTTIYSESAQAQGIGAWSRDDQILGGLVLTVPIPYGPHVTTIYGIRHRVENTHETNLLLSRHPTVAEVGLHYLAGLVFIYKVSEEFPAVRSHLLGGILAVELSVTAHNVNLGWRG